MRLLCFLLPFLSLAFASEDSINFPLFKWAQDRTRVWITVHVSGVQHEKVEFKEQGMQFEGTGKDGKFYRLDLSFRHPINTDTSTFAKLDKNVLVTIFKLDAEASHWPSLLSTTNKAEEGNMRIDWTRWHVEDTETSEDSFVVERRRKSKAESAKAEL